MKNRTDNELWILCAGGDHDACIELFSRYYQLLYGYGCKLTTNVSLVRDTVQELFVSVLTGEISTERLRNTKYTKPYMLRVFRNKLIDSLKEERKYTELTSVDLPNELRYNDLNEQRAEIIAMAYKGLTSRQRDIINLYYVKHMTHDEIAVFFDINYQSSVTLLHRALKSLKESIKRFENNESELKLNFVPI